MRGLAFLAALILAPAAAADLQLSVAVDEEVVRPGVTSANVTVTASLDCAQVLARTTGASTNVEVQVEAAAPTTVVWTGPGALQLPAASCAGPTGRSSATIVYIAGLQGSPPAETPQTVSVTASIPELVPTAVPAEEAVAEFTLKAAAQPAVQVYLAKNSFTVEGATQEVALQFTNLGNVAVTLESKATARNATVGGAFEMPAVQLAVGASTDVTATFETPAGVWDRQVMALEVTPVAASGARGPPIRIEVLFRAPEVDQTAPLPAAGLLALGLLAAAAVAHRRS